MRAEYNEMYDTQTKLFPIIDNEQEILNELRVAFNGFITLQSFIGQASEAAKSYVKDVHNEINAAFATLILDFNARFKNMNDSFKSSVDNGYTPILDTDYMGEIKDKIIGFKNEFGGIHDRINTKLNAVSDIVSFVSLNEFSVKEAYTNTINKVSEDINSFTNFDDAHKNDMEAVNDALSAIRAAIAQAEIYTSNGLNYTPGDFANTDCFSDLRVAQLKCAKFAADNFAALSDDEIGLLTMLGIPLDMLSEYNGNWSDLFDGLGDIVGGADDVMSFVPGVLAFLKLYKTGINYALTATDDGKLFLKISSALSQAQLYKKLLSMGLTEQSLKNFNSLINTQKGLNIFTPASGTRNIGLLNKMGKTAGFELVVDDINKGLGDAAKAAGKETELIKVSKIAKAGKWISRAAYAMTVISDSYSALHNPQTGEWDFSGENIVKAVTDSAIDCGVIWASTEIGAAIGTAIFPGPGSAAGAVAGAIFGTLIYYGATLEFGEPPKSAVDHIKDGVSDACNAVGRFFSKVFW